MGLTWDELFDNSKKLESEELRLAKLKESKTFLNKLFYIARDITEVYEITKNYGNLMSATDARLAVTQERYDEMLYLLITAK